MKYKGILEALAEELGSDKVGVGVREDGGPCELCGTEQASLLVVAGAKGDGSGTGSFTQSICPDRVACRKVREERVSNHTRKVEALFVPLEVD